MVVDRREKMERVERRREKGEQLELMRERIKAMVEALTQYEVYTDAAIAKAKISLADLRKSLDKIKA
jgi:hypothetical protein